jgi:CRISPR/Cas system CMR-associated protein Cmr3 (group 5 of RAMP superfamily)
MSGRIIHRIGGNSKLVSWHRVKKINTIKLTDAQINNSSSGELTANIGIIKM